MEQERKIDVMIAEACHEEYVDIILDTIEAAAKVRGTGIAKRASRLSRIGHCQKNQGDDLPAGPYALASRQDF